MELWLLAGERLPAWLPLLLKRHLATETHLKVLRRLLHLLAALPTPSCSAHCSSSSHLCPPPSSVPTVPLAAASGTHGSNAAAHAGHAVQEYEQVSRLFMQARHPAIRRKGLRALGTALKPIIEALTHMRTDPRSPATQQTSVDALVTQDAPSVQRHSSTLKAQLQPTDSRSAHLDVSTTQQAHAPELRRDQDKSSAPNEPLYPLPSTYQGDVHQQNRGAESNPVQAAAVQAQQAHSRRHAFSSQDDAEGDDSHPPGGEGGPLPPGDNQPALHSLVAAFVSMVEASSKAQQFDDMRLAAATALKASGKQLRPSCHGLCIACWRHSAGLLLRNCVHQDHRSPANTFLQNALLQKGLAQKSLAPGVSGLYARV